MYNRNIKLNFRTSIFACPFVGNRELLKLTKRVQNSRDSHRRLFLIFLLVSEHILPSKLKWLKKSWKVCFFLGGWCFFSPLIFRFDRDLNVGLAHPFQESCKKVIKFWLRLHLHLWKEMLNKNCKKRNLRMKGVKPSSSWGSHNSVIKPLASSLESFSPKIFRF